MSGKDDFNQFFSNVYGERWPRLFASLCSEPQKLALKNPFFAQHPHLEEAYYIDAASVACTAVLPNAEGQTWLDLCAAPGGKSLSLIFRIKDIGRGVLNDSSSARLQRLKAVMHDYLPDTILPRLTFSCHDGRKWGLFEKDIYDVVLVDAPCSGERHLLGNPRELQLWSPRRSKSLSVRQHALLCAALDAAKPGGYILYSTCTISPLENDGVVERFLKKRQGRVEWVKTESPTAESTSLGQMFLPDLSGSGPIYYSLFRKYPLKNEF